MAEPDRAGASGRREVIAAVGKAQRPAIVIGVQSPDVTKAVAFAKHARTAGADAIIALPPRRTAS